MGKKEDREKQRGRKRIRKSNGERRWEKKAGNTDGDGKEIRNLKK